MCAACGPCAGDAGEFGQGDGDFVASGDESGPDCSTKKGRDSESWHRKNAPTKTCKWVERKPSKRCRKKGATGARALTECVRACASCPSEGACVDDATWSHTNKKNKARLRQRRADPRPPLRPARCRGRVPRDVRGLLGVRPSSSNLTPSPTSRTP